MVASLYLERIQHRFQTILRKTRETFAKAYCISPQAIALFRDKGFASVHAEPAIAMYAVCRMARDGAIGVGVIMEGRLPDGRKSLRVYFATKTETFGAEAIIEDGRGWPLLGEWSDCETLPVLQDILKEHGK